MYFEVDCFNCHNFGIEKKKNMNLWSTYFAAEFGNKNLILTHIFFFDNNI